MTDDRSPLANWMIGKAKSLTAEITAQLLTLATSALGLVAALAWNDAIQAVFKEYYPEGRGITPKFVYALLVSLLIIILTINLTRLAKYAKNGRRGTS